MSDGQPSKFMQDRIANEIKNLLKPINKLLVYMVDDQLTTIDEDIGSLVDRLAHSWAKILLTDDNEQAPIVGRKIHRLALISADINEKLKSAQYKSTVGSTFWRSSLGQLVYMRGGTPSGPITTPEAAAILKVTRQAIDAMRREGRLRTTRGNQAPYEIFINARSLRSMWELRKKTAEIKRNRKMEEGIAEFEEQSDVSGTDENVTEFERPSDYDIRIEGRPLGEKAIREVA